MKSNVKAKPKGSTKKLFKLRAVVDVEIEVSEDVLREVMTEDWRNYAYRFRDEEHAAQHLAYNLLEGRSLTSLDGFAHRREDEVVVVNADWDFESWRLD